MDSNQSGLSRRSVLAKGGVLAGAVAAAQLAAAGPLAKSALAENPIFGPLHHVGIVLAPNYDAVMTALTAGLGVEWYPPRFDTLPVRLENGNVGTYSTRVLIGMGGPPYIELLDAVPGTFFNATPSRPVVEIAYVVGTPQNLIDASQLLTDAGMPLVGTIATEPHHEPQPNPVGVAWHEVAPNFLIELLVDDPVPDA